MSVCLHLPRPMSAQSSSTSVAGTLECGPSDVLWELAFQVQAAPTALTYLFFTPSSMKPSCL